MNFLSDDDYIKMFNLKPTDKILDIGGSAKQHNTIQIDTLVDIVTPEEMPYFPSTLTAKKFLKLDITHQRLPFKDKEFDFCFCTHTLEDIYNPFLVIEEMSRVAKRGFISTPSRGKDMEYSHFNLSDWGTGAQRVPGYAHHYWFFEKNGDTMVITPKNYGLLYSSEFHVTKWQGDEEFKFYWNNHINYQVFQSVSFHELIKNYRKFMKTNQRYITKGHPIVYLDNPYYVVKEFAKMLLKRGQSFKQQ